MTSNATMKFPVNCDMGEGFGLYRCGDDEGCIRYVSHINLACGFHASDPNIMWKTVQLAAAHGVGIGAHPGLPDREGFGRRALKITPKEATAMILYQVGALQAFLDREGLELTHIKPHGALFGMAMTDRALANGIADAIEQFEVPVIVVPDCELEDVYRERGFEYYCEFYADLDYDDDGWQIITQVHDAVDPTAAAAKCLQALREGTTSSINGKEVKVRADSICVHSDTPDAVSVAKSVWEAIAEYR